MGCKTGAKQAVKTVWKTVAGTPGVKRDVSGGVGGPGSVGTVIVGAIATPFAAGVGCVSGAIKGDGFDAPKK